LKQNEAPAPVVAAPPAPAPPGNPATKDMKGVSQFLIRLYVTHWNPVLSSLIVFFSYSTLPLTHHVQKPRATASLSIPAGAASQAIASAVQQTHPTPGMMPLIGSPPTALKELPALRDSPPAKREELFIKKLQLCGVIFSFDDPTSDKRGKVSFHYSGQDPLFLD
jgi:hypothetical protein